MDRKNLDDLANHLGFRTEGSAAWGERDGYLVSLLDKGGGAMSVITAVDGRDEPTRLQLDSWLATVKGEGRIGGYTDDNGNVVATLQVSGTSPVDVAGFIDRLVTKLKDLGLRPGCSRCHTAVGAPPAMVSGTAFGVCASCYEQMKTDAEAAAATRLATPSSMARGIIGSLAAALVGSLAWILIGTLGFYASIAGLAIAWMAVKGYTLARGGITRATPFIIAGAILVAVVFAESTGLVIQLMKAGKTQGVELGVAAAIRLLPVMLADGETVTSLLPNFALGLLFAGLGSWRLLRTLHRQALAPVPEVRRL